MFLFVMSWDLYEQFICAWRMKGICLSGRKDRFAASIDDVFQSVRFWDSIKFTTVGDFVLICLFTTSSLLVIGGIVAILWFSTSSLSEPDCHRYLLCWPNDHRLSNSTHRHSAAFKKKAVKLLILSLM